MSILLRKNHGEENLTNIGKLGIISFLGALSASFVLTVWSVHIDNFLNNAAYVGLFSSFLTLVSIISYFILIPTIEKSSKSKLFILSLIIFSFSYLVFALSNNFFLFILSAIIIHITYAIRISSFGLIIKDKSSNKKIARNEGLIYTFTNTAWIIGPLIAGFIASKYSNNTSFAFASLTLVLAIFLFSHFRIKDDRIKKKIDKDLFKNIIVFFYNKKRMISYLIGSGVTFWWSLIYIFMPLYIIENNLNQLWIGIFLFLVPIPLILLEFNISKHAEKIGYNKLFMLGFLIASFFALLCFFTSNIFFIMFYLSLASIGLAMLEPTTESYFFKISLAKEEQRFYAPYNTRIEVGGLLGRFIPSLLILFFPFKFIFLIFSAFMLLFLIISYFAKEN